MSDRIKNILIPLALIVAILISIPGCASTVKQDNNQFTGSFNIIGSNTVTPLATRWAEEFMKTNSGVNIAISGPGTGAGFAALINGTTDICQASRLITETEKKQAAQNNINPYEIQVATDALSVVVNPANPVSELTITQLSGIYSGSITNWKEIGGNDATIVAISRDTNSGTHAFFKEHVVQMLGLPSANKKLEYGTRVLMLPSTEEGAAETAKNVNAIFYAGLGYVTDKVKPLGIKRTAADMAVKPSVKTSLDGTYPISRPLLFYTNGEPKGIIKNYIDYCLSNEGQKLVEEVGYVPLVK